MARAQEITIWGRRGISWLPIQSKIHLVCDSARDISRPRPKGYWPRSQNSLRRIDESSEHLGSSKEDFKEDC